MFGVEDTHANESMRAYGSREKARGRKKKREDTEAVVRLTRATLSQRRALPCRRPPCSGRSIAYAILHWSRGQHGAKSGSM